MNAPFFFGKDMRPMGKFWKNNFSPGGPPHQHSTLWTSRYWQKSGDFQIWGFWEERVGRQGKGAQNLRNEPNDLPQNSWVPIMSCLGEIRFSKFKILKNHPYLTLFSTERLTLPKLRSNKGDFSKFWIWKTNFS